MSKFAKLRITGTIEVKTGLHIGGSSAFSAIGAVDSPVVRDPLSGQPIIPGSSLKGKMRYLLARARSESSESPVLKPANEDGAELLRLFGSSEPVKNSRLKFSDCMLYNHDELRKRAGSSTEVKFENTINRQTSLANPRQIERVIRGAEFGLELIYDVDDVDNEGELEEDFRTLREGFDLIECDYLGGHGSRGSGRVKFHMKKVNVVYGKLDNERLDSCKAILGCAGGIESDSGGAKQ